MTNEKIGSGRITPVRDPMKEVARPDLDIMHERILELVKHAEALRIAEGETAHGKELEAEIVSEYRRWISGFKTIAGLSESLNDVPRLTNSPYIQLLVYRAHDERAAEIVHNELLTFKEPSGLAELKIAVNKFDFYDSELKKKLLGQIQESAGGMWV
ncbi:MAG: hypothetical protein WA021_00920 [Minisyncoccia bacterium]